MACTSSLNCLSCRNPYQTPDSLSCLPLFTEKPFLSLKSASSHPLPKNRLWFMLVLKGVFGGSLKITSENENYCWGKKHHPNRNGCYSNFSKLDLPLHLQCNSNSSIPTIRSAISREHRSMETARHHICIFHAILIRLGQQLNLHLPLQCNSEFFRSLGTTPNSGKTLSEWKGHSRSSRRVPGYSRSSSRNWKFHSRNTKFHSRNGLSRLDQYETHNSRSNSRRIPGIAANPPERFSFAASFSERFFENWGGPRAPDFWTREN